MIWRMNIVPIHHNGLFTWFIMQRSNTLTETSPELQTGLSFPLDSRRDLGSEMHLVFAGLYPGLQTPEPPP